MSFDLNVSFLEHIEIPIAKYHELTLEIGNTNAACKLTH